MRQALTTLLPQILSLVLLYWPDWAVSNSTEINLTTKSHTTDSAIVSYLKHDPAVTLSAIESGEFDSLIDVRKQTDCLQQTLTNAICLPVESLLTDRARLANFSGLLWKLGTAGLAGSEHVLILGDNMARKEFMAGVLHLAGQKKITLLHQPLTEFADNQKQKNKQFFSSGSALPPTRTVVWQALMRSENIVLHKEMQKLQQSGTAMILDGRSDADYWGQTIRAARGGHIPGADSSPYTQWQLDSNTLSANEHAPVIAYAADAYTGIAYYTRLIAAGQNTRLYIDGWRRWAADARLPVDAASYPGSASRAMDPDRALARQASPPALNPQRFGATNWLFWGLSVALAFCCGYIVCRVLQKK